MNLQKMIGPLPLWGWIAVIIAGVGVAWVSTRSSGTETPTEIIPGGAGPGTPGFIPVDPPDSDTGGEGKPLSNDEWARVAIRALIARGNDPGLVNSAITKYLNGELLTTREQAVINIALTLSGVGPPPVAPPPPLDNQPDPDPDPDPDPGDGGSPSSIVVTVGKFPQWNGSLSGIAKRYYGSGNVASWTKIYNANRNKIQNPHKIYPGQRLIVPNPTRNV